jgi:hypothetical protein
MHLVHHIIILTAVSSAVGYLMIVAGLQRSVLERRRRERVCPSCGRNIETRVCRVCTTP